MQTTTTPELRLPCAPSMPTESQTCTHEEHSSVNPVTVGDLVDGTYSIDAEIGRGTSGIVYRARDIWLDRPVALKFVSVGYELKPESANRVRTEARALAAMRNEHIVQVYAFGRHANWYFIAMEYVRGETLDVLLAHYARESSVMPRHRAATIISRISRGLDAVHTQGLVHRDIKPSNIMIEEGSGRPVLLDFGLALTAGEYNLESLEGTPHYLAPEQAFPGEGEEVVGPWTDQYSLACVAFEMLTGKPPFDSLPLPLLLLAHLCDPAPQVSTVQQEAQAFDPILARALAKSTKQRYPSCGLFAEDLLDAASPKHESSPPPTLRQSELEHTNLQILTVDDDPAFARLATKAVQIAARDHSVQIRTAASGYEALMSARVYPPDFVLLDLDMPEINGLETLSFLRALPKGELARVIVLSGRLGPQERWRFSILGVRDFIAKPVDFRNLVHTLSRLLNDRNSPPGKP